MKKSMKLLIAILITVAVSAVGYYIALPPINIYAQEFWLALTFVAVVFGASYLILCFKGKAFELFSGKGKKKKYEDKTKNTVGVKVVIALAVIPIVVLVVGNIISSTFFNATKYSNIITVTERNFEEDMPESDLVTNIPLMDSASANIIGNRTLGALSDVVSQYQVNGTYTQINYKGVPQKVSSLEYVDFFKWLNNHENGIPGYVMVDPVNSSAKYEKYEDNSIPPVRYSESAYFHEDLMRVIRFSHPTKIFGSCTFELDEEGKPYYIVSCMKPTVGLFGAMDVNEVIIFNPCDGTSELYALADTPSWVDNVFTGKLASQKYDWYGTLKNGFWNSVIGNKDCKVTTDDFGYIIRDDDVWFYTGVTSVSSDESNIGFIISNARTGEYRFYSVIGAEEYSAMGAAQGEVQYQGYIASFPSLINVSGEATYIMVLKDANGIVKMHALVNVENYSIVATGVTQSDAKQAYLALLKEEGILVEDNEKPEAPILEEKTAEITVASVRFVTIGGESWAYLVGEDGKLYKKMVSEDETLLLIESGNKLTVKYYDTETDAVRSLLSWEAVKEG